MSNMIFTSESVTAGHPDKLCDQISDAAIDAFLRQDANARVVVECALATGIVFLAARYATEANVDLAALARGVIGRVGYVGDHFDARSCSVLTSLTRLPVESGPPSAGDGGFDSQIAREHANAFGYACRETPELMPLPIMLAHRLARAMDEARRHDARWLLPDAKAQVSVAYEDDQPTRVYGISIVAAGEGVSQPDAEAQLREIALKAVSDAVIPPDHGTETHVSVGGAFDIGGPARHAGLTGRKNGIDTYGEFARQSGAALSGKDPSRIDRIGTYAARHAAKNVVAAGLADRCEVHLAYGIGRVRPLSLSVETFGTGQLDDERIAARLADVLDFRPGAIAERFGLRRRPSDSERGFYRHLAVYGHLGRTDMDLPWEATDVTDVLRG